MKIKTILNQHRRDFTAIYECEHCDHEVEAEGYDDVYYHGTVIPRMKCTECGKIAPESYRPLAVKYTGDELL